MKLIFPDQNVSYNLRSTIGHTVYGGAEKSECLATASRIKNGNYDQWYREWRHLGDRTAYHEGVVGARSPRPYNVVNSIENCCKLVQDGGNKATIQNQRKAYAVSFFNFEFLIPRTAKHQVVPLRGSKLRAASPAGEG